MDIAHRLLRTSIRTFHPSTRSILLLDSLLFHQVLHLDDFNILLRTQAKEIRQYLHPLRSSRFISVHSRKEVKVSSSLNDRPGYSDRTVQRDYYFVNIIEAIDAIKYRIARLRKQVESAYKEDETKGKDWYCPRCKSEYDMMEVLVFSRGEGGYECGKCGYTLVQDEEKIKDRGTGKKMVRLNEQLAKLDGLIAEVDRAIEDGRLRINEVIGPDGKSDGGFAAAWEARIQVKREEGQGPAADKRYMDVKNRREKGPDVVRAENLEVSLKTEGELTEDEKRREEERREKIRLQNLMPEWHAKSAIGLDKNIKTEDTNSTIKAEDVEETKEDTKQAEMDEQMQQYLAQVEKERAEEERKKREEAKENGDENDDEDEDEEEDEFEPVFGSSNVGTPMSTQELRPNNGIKREYEEDSSEAATPASFEAVKRLKIEENGGGSVNGNATPLTPEGGEAESEEDADFEDV